MLTIVGVDGVDWKLIDSMMRHGKLRYFKSIKDKHNHSIFTCEEIPHTAPAWTTIFTGVPPEKHGIFEFVTLNKQEVFEMAYLHPDARPVTRKDVKVPMLWEMLSDVGLNVKVFNIPIAIEPPFCYNADNVTTNKYGWDGKVPGLFEYTRKLKEYYLEIVSQRPDVIIFVISMPDKLHHTIPFDALAGYELVEEMLEDVINNSDEWLIISDHGHPWVKPLRYDEYNIKVPIHDKEGIVMTNLPHTPVNHRQVVPIILEHFGIEHNNKPNLNIACTKQPSSDGHWKLKSADDKSDIIERLKNCGYD